MLAKEENIVVGEKGTYHSILLASSGRSRSAALGEICKVP